MAPLLLPALVLGPDRLELDDDKDIEDEDEGQGQGEAEEGLKAFLPVHNEYRQRDPGARSTLIYTGEQASDDLVLNASTEARPDELCLSQARAVIR